jgi:hypothetical protein
MQNGTLPIHRLFAAENVQISAVFIYFYRLTVVAGPYGRQQYRLE